MRGGVLRGEGAQCGELLLQQASDVQDLGLPCQLAFFDHCYRTFVFHARQAAFFPEHLLANQVEDL